MGMRPSLLLCSLLLGCADSHGLPGEAPPDAPAADVFEGLADAPLGFDACIAPIGPRRRISEEMARCIGIAERDCAGCHLVDGFFELSPMAPSPPPGAVSTIPTTCGLCL
jgi:hypothetical protein